jgi:hypothetical protein
MASKFNFSSVQSYSTTYTQKLLQEFFSGHQVITGQQILELTAIKQLNLLTIRELFFQWKEEMERIKSPYFDYDHEEVQEAFTGFRNALSRHIAIREQDFAPLFKKSVKNTLMLIFSPYDFFSMEVTRANQPTISYEEVKSWSKYIKVNAYMLDALIGNFEDRQIQEMPVAQALELFDMVKLDQQEVPEVFHNYLSKFSEVAPLALEQVLENAAELQQDEMPEDSSSAQEPRHQIQQEEQRPQDEEPKYEQPKYEEPKYEQRKQEEPRYEEKPQKPEQPVEHSREEQKKSLYEQYQNQQNKTLNEELAVKQQNKSIADTHAKKLVNLSKSISINQRFMFIKELFGGDHQTFEQALKWLENCGSYSEALNFLTETYANKYNWTMDKEEVIEFLELIAKKFD